MSKYVYYAADFETTVYDGQKNTEVWAGGISPLFKADDNLSLFNSIEGFFDYIKKQGSKHMGIFFHNLKFDGSFILSYLIKIGFNFYVPIKNEPVPDKKYSCLISDMGQWYSIRFSWSGKDVVIYDSLKLLPFPLKKIAKDFNLSRQKLTMKYKGLRFPNQKFTESEKDYLSNDVLILKEALEIFIKDYGFSMTSASAAMNYFKKYCSDRSEFDSFFPNCVKMNLNKKIFGSSNVDEYIRQAYHGGYCYKARNGEYFKNGCTFDVNSLYPSMMLSESGNRFPVGKPKFFIGEIPDKIRGNNKYFYFVRIKAKFKVKPGYLPTIQIKHNYLYDPTSWLETSDIRYYDKKLKKYCYSEYYKDIYGNIKPAIVEMTLTGLDYELFIEHYNIDYLEILDGCYFSTMFGLFDQYVNYFRKIKETSKGAPRALAKLFLNSLYGKFATSIISSYMEPISEPGQPLRFQMIYEENKKPVYIPIGAAITAYARNYTIRAAQKNFYGKNKPGFIYADTDSIHLDISPDQVKGIEIDDVEFGKWKLESVWKEGRYIRQKTYMDIYTDNSIDIKCAGMPDRCKMLFAISARRKLHGKTFEDFRELDLTNEEKVFCSQKRELEDFTTGLIVPGKLLAKQFNGGILLQSTTYELRLKK